MISLLHHLWTSEAGFWNSFEASRHGKRNIKQSRLPAGLTTARPGTCTWIRIIYTRNGRSVAPRPSPRRSEPDDSERNRNLLLSSSWRKYLQVFFLYIQKSSVVFFYNVFDGLGYTVQHEASSSSSSSSFSSSSFSSFLFIISRDESLMLCLSGFLPPPSLSSSLSIYILSLLHSSLSLFILPLFHSSLCLPLWYW